MPYDDPSPAWQAHQTWLDEARAGSTVALGRLFETCLPDLLWIANADEERWLRQKVDPEDLVQQVFLEAHRDWHQFYGQTPVELQAWLRQILRHKLSNLSRWFHGQKHDIRREIQFDETNISEVSSHLPTDGEGASGEVDSGDGGRPAGVIERILARLPVDYRRVIELRIRENLSIVEIADLMKRSPAATRKLLSRALDRARQDLERRGASVQGSGD